MQKINSSVDADFDAIAKGQLRSVEIAEEKAKLAGKKVIFCDTDALITVMVEDPLTIVHSFFTVG